MGPATDTVELHEATYNGLRMALAELQARAASRENSLAITHLETAMMWFNKDRANKGELEKNDTHV